MTVANCRGKREREMGGGRGRREREEGEKKRGGHIVIDFVPEAR